MAGKWSILDERGKSKGKPTLFPPSKIEPNERVSYVEELKVDIATGGVHQVIKDAISRGSARVYSGFAYVNVDIQVTADTPELALKILDQLLTKAGVNHSHNFEE